MSKADLIKALNGDLAGEYQAIITYATYAASVTGPHRPMLEQFFAAEIPEELTHAQFLADKIASLSAEPTTAPRAVPQTTDPRQMLQNVLEAERQTIADYKQRAEQAAALAEKGLATHLETIVEDETSHFEAREVPALPYRRIADPETSWVLKRLNMLGKMQQSLFVNRGVDRMRRLVCEFYDGFSFGNFVRSYPHLRNTITDLLIGDLFTDRVDAVWEPMESLYAPGKAPIPPWNAGTPGEALEEKAPHLVLPEGPTR